MSSLPNQKARLNKNDQIDFLRDFDLLTSVPAEQSALFNEADLEVGQTMTKSTFVLRQDKSKYSIGCHIDQFRIFGPGIYLLFKLLKYLTFAFGIVSLLSIASLIILMSGDHAHQTIISNQFKVGILKTTIYCLTEADFSSYVGINFAITVILTCFLTYWCQKQRSFVIQCLKCFSLASYSTVILSKLPQKYNQKNLQQYLSLKYGEIAEIYTVRNFGDDILYYKQMSQIVQDYKQQKKLTQIEPQRTCHTLANLFFQFRSGHIKLKQRIKVSENYKPCFAFVQFRKVQDREKLLLVDNKMHFLDCFKKRNKKHNQNQNQQQCPFQQIKIKQCEMQPCGIVWENLHLTKSSQILKTGVMMLLMVIVLGLSIFFIIFLSIVQMSIMNSKFKDLPRSQILSMKDNFALLSYCINLSVSKFYQQSDICNSYNSQYFKLTFLMLMIPLSISLFKLALTQIMKALVNFRRYAYEIKKIQSQSTIIFVFYFLVTGPLQLVIYLGSQSTSFFDIFTPLIQSIVSKDFRPSKITLFSDYIPDWYITASYNVIMIGAISFNLSAIGIIFYCFFRRKIFYYMAKKQKIQVQMNSWLKGYILQIEYVYAALLTIVYFTLLFGGNMPLLYILAFLSCLILFWSYKYIFINFCARPLTYNHSINRRVTKIIFGAIILHCVFTPVFYRAKGIANFNNSQGFLQRIFSLWYYFVWIIILTVYLFAAKPIKLLILILRQYLKKKQEKQDKAHQNQRRPSMEEDLPLPYHVKRKNIMLPTIVRKKHNQQVQQSYSMHENQRYKKILKALYTINNKQRARKSCELNKDLFLLYEDTIKTNDQQKQNDYRTLIQVIKLVRRDFKKHQTKHGRGKNPYENSKRKLYEIYDHSKKGQNHKYTLCFKGPNGLKDLMNSNGLSSSDNSQFNNQKKSDNFYLDQEKNSNATKTKQIFLQSNLEQVMEVSQFEEEQQTEKNKNKKWLTPSKLALKPPKIVFPNNKMQKLPCILQAPQQSEKKINNSKI